MATPPIREQFFEGEVEIQSKSGPPVKLPVLFKRTVRSWAEWASRTSKALGFPIQSLTVTATLDFPLVAANGGTQDLTVTVAGVVATDPQPVVDVGLSSGLTAGLLYHGFVSADDTVTVRCTNATAGAINPAAAVFRVEVRRY